MPVQKPRARTDDLVIEEVDDELLVYDSTNKRGHCLSATAARVWRACDGYSDVSALSEALELDAEVVSQALDELDALELLDTQGMKVVQAGSGNGDGLTRRQLAGRSARVGAGLAAAPLVYSINVSSAMALATPTPFQCALFTTKSCGTSRVRSHRQAAAAAARVAAPARSAARPPSATRRPRSRAPRCRAAAFGTNCSVASGDEVPGRRRAAAARVNGLQMTDGCGCGFGAGLRGLLQPEHRCRLARRAATGNPDCFPCCNGEPCSSPRSPTLGCCKSATVNCCDAPALTPAEAGMLQRVVPERSTAAAPRPAPAPAAPPPAAAASLALTGGVSGPGPRACARA